VRAFVERAIVASARSVLQRVAGARANVSMLLRAIPNCPERLNRASIPRLEGGWNKGRLMRPAQAGSTR
jgi:hypothetical protein